MTGQTGQEKNSNENSGTNSHLTAQTLWKRYCRYLITDRDLGFSLDVSRVQFDEEYLQQMSAAMNEAITAMERLEQGAIANQDEQRMVGHYWLRTPTLAPTPEITSAILQSIEQIEQFTADVHRGNLSGQNGAFTDLLHIGIGGSALGPQFVSQAIGSTEDKLRLHFVDNTDPDGIDLVLDRLHDKLGQTLVTVVSKSGTTPEPNNGMLEVRAAYRRVGLDFASHAVAVTVAGSRLDRIAKGQEWIGRFPMWDWVGGRTSVMAAAGLLPLALQGIDIRSLLDGAATIDRLTRVRDLRANPAAMFALMWHKLGGGRGNKDMIVLPYKDRLLLLGRYLQQLVMESLGKQFDRSGAIVHQGIAVYGNKGSTDQHAYVQQLREGLANFFAVFIQVLHDRDGRSLEVEPGVTTGDYLLGFLHGTRCALYENQRESITITLDRVSATSVGAMIGLFDRTVGLYAELININAYHQPGVEAGKKAAAAVIELQTRVLSHLAHIDGEHTADQISAAIGHTGESEAVYKILQHLAANPERGITMKDAKSPQDVTFRGQSLCPQP